MWIVIGLKGLCRKINVVKERETKGKGTKKHRQPSVKCQESGQRVYIGQTGRCVNDRLREHHYNVSKQISDHLGIHCRDCGFTPDFKRSGIIKKSRYKLTTEIMEACEINKQNVKCIIMPSVTLSNKELQYLT